MRSTLFSAIVIASAVSSALGAPAAASVSASVRASASAAANARPSALADPLPEKWDHHMKMVLPDGLFPEDNQIVPMMVMEDVRDKTVQKSQQIKGYKKIGLTDNGETSLDVTEVTPLLPSLQNDVSIASQIDTSEDVVGNERRYKKFLGVSDNGDKQEISIPGYEKTNAVIVEEEQVYPLGVEGKTRVVVDKYGNMRYLDIPYYSRAASAAAASDQE